MKLYHATSINNLNSIKKNGLSGVYTKVRPGYIHLALDIFTASIYHQHWEDTDTVILSIDSSLLDEELLGPDREDLMEVIPDDRKWDEIDWDESLQLSGNCTYSGIIPFDFLNIEKTIREENNKTHTYAI